MLGRLQHDERKGDGEEGAGSRRARNVHPPSVSFNDRLDEAQAKTEAALGPALVATIEAVPDAGEVDRRDADPVVLHGNHGGACPVAHPHVDVAATQRVFDRVVLEVREHLAHTGGIRV